MYTKLVIQRVVIRSQNLYTHRNRKYFLTFMKNVYTTFKVYLMHVPQTHRFRESILLMSSIYYDINIIWVGIEGE